uniref:BZIP domain-containing protein n=1 Tax=Mucochytrium quahogii TaxID=96639 RepID=A0A7S2RQZ7_9STRA|mmetsp:Transcript_13219/g.23694  ORF Transcript_13219/g.23694 Transcript_13219/m.23694 type:complete len:157 (+) Transcript_13219:266-736(+)|eukprot:CAMPEP_0203755562 /NCGR_PEP_ID=MMETSP0098-20131031/8986_1 /ASSEMBLY_ACC=CAM_ASM_000208 /TAXON_ID=96639 /ORGANISM=" , Strain NY0313808BC1" /LENGTH=156 /DNA_ID=CAMNT_0050647071 /DNA_START=206 /DNA_END=676 /DNA_ORIENTATION=+
MSGEYNPHDLDDDKNKVVGAHERKVQRRKQNSIAARRFRLKRKQALSEIKGENAQLLSEIRNMVNLLEQSKKYLYSVNTSVRSFPRLPDIEAAIQDHRAQGEQKPDTIVGITSLPIGGRITIEKALDRMEKNVVDKLDEFWGDHHSMHHDKRVRLH